MLPECVPYDENGAVAVMTSKHFLSLVQFDAGHDKELHCMLRRISGRRFPKTTQAVYQSINWNYMPLAGGLDHPSSSAGKLHPLRPRIYIMKLYALEGLFCTGIRGLLG